MKTVKHIHSMMPFAVEYDDGQAVHGAIRRDLSVKDAPPEWVVYANLGPVRFEAVVPCQTWDGFHAGYEAAAQEEARRVEARMREEHMAQQQAIVLPVSGVTADQIGKASGTKVLQAQFRK